MTPVMRSASPLAGVMAAQPPSSKRSEVISSSHRAREAIFLSAKQYQVTATRSVVLASRRTTTAAQAMASSSAIAGWRADSS